MVDEYRGYINNFNQWLHTPTSRTPTLERGFFLRDTENWSQKHVEFSYLIYSIYIYTGWWFQPL